MIYTGKQGNFLAMRILFLLTISFSINSMAHSEFRPKTVNHEDALYTDYRMKRELKGKSPMSKEDWLKRYGQRLIKTQSK